MYVVLQFCILLCSSVYTVLYCVVAHSYNQETVPMSPDPSPHRDWGAGNETRLAYEVGGRGCSPHLTQITAYAYVFDPLVVAIILYASTTGDGVNS